MDLHFAWIERMVRRLLSQKDGNDAKPLLSLSFCESNKPEIPEVSVQFPIDMDVASEGTVYGLVCSIFGKIDFGNVFESVLATLSGIGFKPQQPCTVEGLRGKSETDHVNLCLVIEFAVSSKSFTVDSLLSDLKRLPRSFFVLKNSPFMMDEAVALWLSKFPCLVSLPEIDKENLQQFTSKGMHIAGVFSRMFPNRVPKNEIVSKIDLTPDEITKNWGMCQPILDEIGAFTLKQSEVPEQLFMVFIADVFHATRSAVKKFVKVDAPPVIVLLPPPIPQRPATAPECPGTGAKKPSVEETKKPTPVQKKGSEANRSATPLGKPGTTKMAKESKVKSESNVKIVKKKPLKKVSQEPKPVSDVTQSSSEEKSQPKPKKEVKVIKGNSSADVDRSVEKLLKDFLVRHPGMAPEESVQKAVPLVSKALRRKRKPTDAAKLIRDIEAIVQREEEKKVVMEICLTFLFEIAEAEDTETNLHELAKNVAADPDAKKKVGARPQVQFVGIPPGLGIPKHTEPEDDWDPMAGPDPSVLMELEKKFGANIGDEFHAQKINDATKIVPNIKTIAIALKFNSIPGPANDAMREDLMRFLEKDFSDCRIVILMASRTQRFKGLYVVASHGGIAQKIWGQGPVEIDADFIEAYWKYDTSTKLFVPLQVRQFTQTTDGFYLKKQYEGNGW